LEDDAFTIETDWDGDKIQVSIEGVKPALEKLSKDHAYLLAEPKAPGGPGPRPTTPMSKKKATKGQPSGFRAKL
jgi:hypothetical protein